MITEHQRQQRQKGLGASDLAAILYVDEYATGADVQAQKLYGVTIPENEAMRIGSALERPVIELAEPTIGPVTYRHTRRRIKDSPIVCNLDAIAKRDGSPVEAKTHAIVGRGNASQWGESGTADVPQRVIVQTTAQMAAIGAERCYVVALIAGRGVVVFEVPFDAELAELIVTRARAWWQTHIVERQPVPHQTPALDILKRIERPAGKTVELGEYAEGVALEWRQAREQRLTVEKDEEDFQRQAIAALGDAEIGILPCGATVEYRATTDRRLNQQKLKSEYPQVYAACLAESITRTLRLKGAPNGLGQLTGDSGPADGN